ncbi:magnesium/cobalt transporter CorA [Synoicihabitans lomoniglobus]|uniref:Magnesium transport protein CorA n=1 Tax=Synoicihabitans lomoniglobus TaxID=2909285 RepID=A0AAE9ZZ64_9BACT|nr:magnesium/cobalt transporter CorA [Opitutaceae bacterium LMO-M01]WED65438.1 magnesium/cobalt transporter CorA [Opitutaceae bacterium LMO-M01]
MISSFIFSDGKVVGTDLEVSALRLVRSDKGLFTWIDLSDPTPVEIKDILEGVFAFHPLAIEDCVTPSDVPKLEDYEDYLFLVMHAVDFTRTEKFTTTELNMFLGKNFIVTFRRAELKAVAGVVERCRRATGQWAKAPDRIAHHVLDAIIDLYQPVTEEFREELEDIEEQLLSPEQKDLIPMLLETRGELSHLRRIIAPQRDVINRLALGESDLIRPVMLPYFRDLRDNLVRINERAITYSDQLLIAFDLFLSKSGFQANEGIKVLTALTAITLPAMVIGTWFGMNFQHMPELRTAIGYPVVIGLTVSISALMWWWCKKRRWI